MKKAVTELIEPAGLGRVIHCWEHAKARLRICIVDRFNPATNTYPHFTMAR